MDGNDSPLLAPFANPYTGACQNYRSCNHDTGEGPPVPAAPPNIFDGGSPQLPPSPLQSSPTPSSSKLQFSSQIPPSSPSTIDSPPSLPSPSPSPPSPPSPPFVLASPSNSSAGQVIGASIACVISVSIVAAIIYCLCRKKRTNTTHHAHPIHQEATLCPPFLNKIFFKPCTGSVGNEPQRIKQGYNASPNSSKFLFTYRELEVATDGFSISNKLGEGGFGCVYKGILSDGRIVAVKQLKEGVVQGENQFQAEVEIISRVHHRHLVSLVGYCSSRQRRLLVYNFLANGTLDHHLHGRESGHKALDWPTRVRIAWGAARGLAYLHEDCHPRIIHRDIKSSNILLDEKFEAQVSDFGLARLTSDADTHVTTRVMGTFGYLAPEYASSGKLTEKSDVFSFGVVLLELLTGRKPVDSFQPLGQESLVEWARPIIGQINSKEYLDVIADPSLNGEYDSNEMLQMVEVAIACVSHSPAQRPRMGQVVTTLETQISLLELNKGLRLGQTTRDLDLVEQSSINNNIEMRALKKSPLEIQEFKNNYKGAIHVEYKMNNPSCEMMPNNDYEQTSTSRETRSGSNPTTSMSSSFSSVV